MEQAGFHGERFIRSRVQQRQLPKEPAWQKTAQPNVGEPVCPETQSSRESFLLQSINGQTHMQNTNLMTERSINNSCLSKNRGVNYAGVSMTVQLSLVQTKCRASS